MNALELRQLSKRYGSTTILHQLDLSVPAGEFLVLLGPSGCGKSTLLRMIAGLDEISEGELWLQGKLANNTPAAQRGLAMVFQSYALYPHMSVFDNMAFSLKLAGLSKAQILQQVEQAAAVLQIGHLLTRKPKDLSGGQRQRVAIGRAIVRKPALFLFDEPLSNLDAALRVQMRMELARLHRELGATMIYVTHDQVEAMTLGQRIAIFNQGQIQQLGTPLELYQKPANQFVAGFLGTPKMNFLSVNLQASEPERISLSFDDGQVCTLSGVGGLAGLPPATGLTLGIRPEHCSISSTAVPDSLKLSLQFIEHLGDAVVYYAHLAGQTVAIKLAAESQLLPAMTSGASLYLRFNPAQLHFFAESGQRLN